MGGSDMGAYRLDRVRVREPRFLLLYPPLQFAPGEVAKPDGSLSLTYLAGALRAAGYDVRILDCAVGPEDSPLQDSFFNVTPLPSGLRRVGMPVEAILAMAASYDAIGLSSIFTPQTTACLDLIRQIRAAYPDKLIMAGGVNARSLRRRFYASGVDLIAMSEAEETVVRVAGALEGKEQLSAIPGIAFLDEAGAERITKSAPVLQDLDQLPFPAWDLLPLRVPTAAISRRAKPSATRRCKPRAAARFTVNTATSRWSKPIRRTAISAGSGRSRSSASAGNSRPSSSSGSSTSISRTTACSPRSAAPPKSSGW
jgi:hypothetical protein